MTPPEPREEKLFLPDPEHEPIVVKVRAVCGALGGIFVAGLIWLEFELSAIPTLLLFTAVPAVFSYGAVRYGDVFWTDRISRWRW